MLRSTRYPRDPPHEGHDLMATRDWAESDYSRVYHTVVDEDPKFDGVYDDDRMLAAWLRLLLAADAMYPAPPPLPRWLADDVMDRLVEKRIIELIRGGNYRLTGLRPEREGRQTGNSIGGKARVAGAVRDEHGRFVAGETLDNAGHAGSVAGTDAGASDAGPADAPAIQRSRAEPSTSLAKDSPQPPASGGRGSRSNGTTPRQLAAAAQAKVDEANEGRRYRVNQRLLAYSRGAISEAQQSDMNRRDAQLDEIPDWLEHLAKLDGPSWLTGEAKP